MFPFNQYDNSLYQIYSNSYQQDTIRQDQTLGHVVGDGGTINVITNNTTPRRNTLLTSKDDYGHGELYDIKKKIHRDIEKQRRQEMAAHFSSLRSLLPYEYIKGKRSMSDQIYGASNYIKHTQKRVHELASKRDQLKRFSKLTESSSKWAQSSVVAKFHGDGLEIIFKTCIGNQQEFLLSKVLDLLMNEGHEIVNLISAKVSNDIVHTIKSQVGDFTDFDLSELQQKLMELISVSK